jgi:hypothetical protein
MDATAFMCLLAGPSPSGLFSWCNPLCRFQYNFSVFAKHKRDHDSQTGSVYILFKSPNIQALLLNLWLLHQSAHSTTYCAYKTQPTCQEEGGEVSKITIIHMPRTSSACLFSNKKKLCFWLLCPPFDFSPLWEPASSLLSASVVKGSWKSNQGKNNYSM